MTTIKLINGYFVEVDAMNYTLKQSYVTKGKDGIGKEAIKTHGYYSKLEYAVERVITLLQLDKMDDLTLQFHDYVEMVKQANKDAVHALKGTLEVLENGLNEVK